MTIAIGLWWLRAPFSRMAESRYEVLHKEVEDDATLKNL